MATSIEDNRRFSYVRWLDETPSLFGVCCDAATLGLSERVVGTDRQIRADQAFPVVGSHEADQTILLSFLVRADLGDHGADLAQAGLTMAALQAITAECGDLQSVELAYGWPNRIVAIDTGNGRSESNLGKICTQEVLDGNGRNVTIASVYLCLDATAGLIATEPQTPQSTQTPTAETTPDPQIPHNQAPSTTQPSSMLPDHHPSRFAIIHNLVERFGQLLDLVDAAALPRPGIEQSAHPSAGRIELFKALNERCTIIGRSVQITCDSLAHTGPDEQTDGTVSGRVSHVDSRGRIVVETLGGARRFRSSEVSSMIVN